MQRKKRRNLNSQTVAYLQSRGCLAEVVERYNCHAGRSADLFGFIDVIGVTPTGQTLFIQVTSKGNIGARLKKMSFPPLVATVAELSSRAQVFILGWGAPGDAQQYKEIQVTTGLLMGLSQKEIDRIRLLVYDLGNISPVVRSWDSLYFYGEDADLERIKFSLLGWHGVDSIILPLVSEHAQSCLWPLWAQRDKSVIP